jgi:hypothetical protein
VQAYSLAQRKYKFYNAGDRIQNPLLYSNPDSHDIHVLCRFNLDAPAEGVFFVPEVIQVGMAEVHVNFAADITRDYGSRGVILIDANYEPPRKQREVTTENGTEYVIDEDSPIDEEADAIMPVARNVDEAKKKGKALWGQFIQLIVTRHMEQCEQIRAAGGVPIAATGVIKRALKLAGYTDPAEHMLLESRKQTQALEQIRDQAKKEGEDKDARIARLEALVESLVADKKKETPEPELAGAGKGKTKA